MDDGTGTGTRLTPEQLTSVTTLDAAVQRHDGGQTAAATTGVSGIIISRSSCVTPTTMAEASASPLRRRASHMSTEPTSLTL